MADQVDKNSGVGKDADLASRVPNVISIPEITGVSASENKATAPASDSANSAPQPADSPAVSAATVPATAASAPEPAAASSGDAASAKAAESSSRGETSVVSVAASRSEETPGNGSEFKLDPSRPSVKDSGHRTKAKGKRGKKGASAKDDASKRDSAKESSAKSASLRKRLIAAGLVVLIIAVIVLGVSWARWWRFDDAQDIQGQWFSANTTGTAIVNVDGETIRLASDVAYSYTLDTTAKTIQYDFGPMHGQGRYWFSDDRSTLVIADGTDFTTTSTLLEDIALWWKGLFASITGAEKPVLQSDNSICLTRTDPSAANAVEAETSANAGMGAGAESDAQKVTEAQQKAQQEQQERQAQLAAQKQEEQARESEAAGDQPADQQQPAEQVGAAGEAASNQPADSQQVDQ